MLGKLYAEEGRPEKAIESLRRALELSPGNAFLERRLAELEGEGGS